MRPTIRLDCEGRSAREVLRDLVGALPARPGRRRVVLLIENAGRIRDSLSRLLRGLLAFFTDRKIHAAIVDPTGCTETVARALGDRVHVEVCRDEDQVGRPLDILVVEDTADSLEFVRTLLRSAGHRVSTARSGRQALRACAKRTFDLVLLDLVLPDLDGLSVARRLPGRKPALVAMSAYLDRFRDRDFEEAGFRARLRKPFRTQELLAVLR